MAPLPGGKDPKELERGKIFDETCWIAYCFCEGLGVGRFDNPFCASESKNLCLRTSVSTANIMADDGLCGGVSILLCMTEQFQFPPVEGAPTCACFGSKCLGSKGTTKWKTGLFEQKKIMDETLWLYYVICGGMGFNKMDQGLFASQFKELCCRGFTVIEAPAIEGKFCSSVGTTLCFWSECSLPPAEGNPMISLFGWRWKNKKGEKGAAPSQMEMS